MTATVSVLSALLETTVPSRTLRAVRAGASGASGVAGGASSAGEASGAGSATGCSEFVSTSLMSLACLCRGDLALADVGVDAGDLLAHRADLGVVVERAGGIAKAQVERLLLGGAQLLDEGFDVELLELGVGLGGHLRTPPRE